MVWAPLSGRSELRFPTIKVFHRDSEIAPTEFHRDSEIARTEAVSTYFYNSL